MSNNIYNNDSQNQKPEFGKYLVVVSLKGKDSENLNLTTNGHMKFKQDDE